MQYSSAYFIKKFGLKNHPEGGYYREIYRDKTIIKNIFNNDRSCSTAIYYLLEKDNFSSFHQIQSDELWHYYYGNVGLIIYELKKNGDLIMHHLGNDISNGESFVCVIEKESWFAAELSRCSHSDYALVGCTVSPGFEYQDFKIGDFKELSSHFPKYKDLIRKLT